MLIPFNTVRGLTLLGSIIEDLAIPKFSKTISFLRMIGFFFSLPVYYVLDNNVIDLEQGTYSSLDPFSSILRMLLFS